MSLTWERRPLYLLNAFGLQNPWVLWGLQEGSLSEYCPACQGRGEVVTSPCQNREPWSVEPCSLESGCARCVRRCSACRGSRLRPDDEVRAEDFGDETSREIAEDLFPGLLVNDLQPRMVVDDGGSGR